MLYHHRILHIPAQVTAQVPALATVHTNGSVISKCSNSTIRDTDPFNLIHSHTEETQPTVIEDTSESTTQASDTSPAAQLQDVMKHSQDTAKIFDTLQRVKQQEGDVTLLMMAHLMSMSNGQAKANTTPATHTQDSIERRLRTMGPNDNICTVLEEFTDVMERYGVPESEYMSYLPLTLSGIYKETYANQRRACTFAQMQRVLMAAGGYTAQVGFADLPLKYNNNSNDSVASWFKHWTNKFTALLASLSPMDRLPIDLQLKLLLLLVSLQECHHQSGRQVNLPTMPTGTRL